MATLRAYQVLDMIRADDAILWGDFYSATETEIWVGSPYGPEEDGDGNSLYGGSFLYDQSGDLTGGEIASIYRGRWGVFADQPDSFTSEWYSVEIWDHQSIEVLPFVDLVQQGKTTQALVYLLQGNDIVQGSGASDYLLAGDGNDTIDGRGGADTLIGGLGDDTIGGGFGNDVIFGGGGTDSAFYTDNLAAIIAAEEVVPGTVLIRTGSGTDRLVGIADAIFEDGTLTIEELTSQYAPPEYQTSNGTVQSEIYDGPVDFLDLQLLLSDQGESAAGSVYNDFINLLGGDDAANGGGGRDVLDGGTGSNFLTGGDGNDVFFLDGREAERTWSTITDFSTGDNVNIWGWQEGVSQLILIEENQGAAGYTGATYHYDLNGNNLIETSVTFSNLTVGDLPIPTAQEVAGNGYLLFA